MKKVFDNEKILKNVFSLKLAKINRFDQVKCLLLHENKRYEKYLNCIRL